MTTQAMEVLNPGQAPQVIRTRNEFHGHLQEWHKQQYHVLTPAADFAALPPQWGLLPVKVQIDYSQESKEVYRDPLFCKDNEVALSKIGLTRIMQAAGMSSDTTRTDPRTIQHYWEFKATVTVIGLDGTRKSWSATALLDLRDGSDQALKAMGKNRSESALSAARVHGSRLCETKAINAAIRQYGIAQKYSWQELQRPFVVLMMQFHPDFSDPVQAAIATQMALGGSSALFGSVPLPALPPAQDADAIDAKPGTTRVAPEQTRQEPKILVEKVDYDVESETFTIRLTGGRELLTDDLEVGKALQRAKKSGHAVAFETEKRGDQVFITELQVQAPKESSPEPVKSSPSAQSPRPQSQKAQTDTRPMGARKVVKVNKKDMKAGDSGRTFPLATVVFDSGEEAKTTDFKLIALAEQAEKSGAWVRVTTENSARYANQIDLKGLTIVDPNERDLPLGEEEDGGY